MPNVHEHKDSIEFDYLEIEAIKKVVSILHERKYLSLADLARIADVQDGTLRNFVAGKALRPRGPFICKIKDALTKQPRIISIVKRLDHSQSTDDREEGDLEQSLKIIFGEEETRIADFDFFFRWAGANSVATENIIEVYSGSYNVFRPTHQKNGVSFSRLTIGKSEVDSRLCGFSEVENILGDRTILTLGYVIRAARNLLFIGADQNTKIAKFMFVEDNMTRINNLRGIMMTMTSVEGLPFGTPVYLMRDDDPQDSLKRYKGYDIEDFIGMMPQIEHLVLEQLRAASNGVLSFPYKRLDGISKSRRKKD